MSSSSTTRRIPGIKISAKNRGVGIVELCCSRLNPSPRLTAIPGKDEEIHFGAGGLSKTFPGVPIEFREERGNPDSRPRVDWERGTFQSCSLSPDRKTNSLHSIHSPCLAESGSETRADSSKKVLLSFEHEVHLSQLSSSFRLCKTNSQYFLNFHAI